jgi:TonB family protein
LRVVIDPRGHVRDAAVPQSTMIWSVPRCLTEAARTWRFDPPPGGVTVVVVYPIAFVQ